MNEDSLQRSVRGFTTAATLFARMTRRIGPDQWNAPALGSWDIRSLVGHTSRALLTVENYLFQPATEEQVTSAAAYFAAAVGVDHEQVAERGRQAGLALGLDPSTAVDALVARVLPLVAEAGDPLINTVCGGMWLRNYLPTRSFELVVHSLDLSKAVGVRAPDFGPELLAEVAAIAAGAAAYTGRGLPVLRALTGRGRLPARFSVT